MLLIQKSGTFVQTVWFVDLVGVCGFFRKILGLAAFDLERHFLSCRFKDHS